MSYVLSPPSIDSQPHITPEGSGVTDDEFYRLKTQLVEEYLRFVDVNEQLDYLPVETLAGLRDCDKASMKQRWSSELEAALDEFWLDRKKKGVLTDTQSVRAAWERKAKRKKGNRKDQFKRRQKVIDAYGGKCERCGETRWEYLAIDHISGGGTDERRHHGNGDNLLRYLRKQGYPSGYRVLCHNCNFSLGKYGYCPLPISRAGAALSSAVSHGFHGREGGLCP